MSISLALALVALSARAQSRKDIVLTEPGRLHILGDNRATYNFRQYSYGIGSLGGTGSRGAVSVPGGSVGSAADFTISRSGRRASAPTGASIAGGMPTIRLRKGTQTIISRVPVARMTPALYGGAAIGLTTAQAYLQAIDARPAASVVQQTSRLASLLPQARDEYAEHMADAEEAFGRGDYRKALRQYRRANELSPDDPESLLGMAWTSFATSRFSYASAALYLARAIQRLPEMPLVGPHPAGLYTDRATYETHLGYLQAHLDGRPADAEGHLILGVLRWFEGDATAASDALRRGAAATKNVEILRAIETFWDGMAAGGKVGGSLGPTSRPVEPEESGQAAPSKQASAE